VNVNDLSGRWALVTGAASGIGRATALALARRGADLVICDIDEVGLDRVRGEIEALGRAVLARAVDVADREQMRTFAETVHTEIPAVDILVNNAGVAVTATFVDTTLEDWDWILGINLVGVIHGCHFFVPRMIERGAGGHVVNISSTAGYFALGMMSAYNATKFAVRGMSEAMRGELAVHGIGVTAVCPGIIDTPIVGKMRVRGGDEEESRRRAVQVFTRRAYSPERLAEGILKAIRKNKAVAPITPEARLFWWITRWSPWLAHWMNRRGSARVAREAEEAHRVAG
jgi:NAD(P)-dependent dehydrogenase (short-subunit alcohol dehydrogenase family)